MRILAGLVGALAWLTWASPAPAGPHGQTLNLADGDYVQGRAEAGRLDLFGPDGRHVRRFSGGDAVDFAFVAPLSGAYRLKHEDGGTVNVASVQPRDRQPRALAAPSPLPSRISALRDELAGGGSTAAFWREIADGPGYLTEPAGDGQVRLTFLWRGDAHTRTVHLRWGVWAARLDDNAFERLLDSDVWFHTVTVPAGARLTYQVAPDAPMASDGPRADRRRAIVAVSRADPLNPLHWPLDPALSDYERDSVVELEGAAPLTFVRRRAGAASGALDRFQLASDRLGDEREIVVYRPAGVPAETDLPLLIVFDADRYLGSIPAPVILDNLIADGRIPPVTAVFVANPTPAARARQLACNPDFSDFLADEILPAVRARVAIVERPERTIVAGSSFGGLASACAALHRPERFGVVLSQSGSFWWAPQGDGAVGTESEANWVARAFAEAPRRDIVFYLDAGALEQGSGIRDNTRHLRDVLRAKGYVVAHREFPGGHDDISWAGTLSDGLEALLGSVRR